MTEDTTPTRKTWFKTRRFFAAAVFGVVVIGTPVADVFSTREKIYPGITVGSAEIGGLTTEQGIAALEEYCHSFLEQHAVFTLEDQQISLPLSEIVAFDTEATIGNALQIGHQNSITKTIQQRFDARLSGIAIDPVLAIKQDSLESSIREAFPEYKTKSEDAKFTFVFEEDKQPSISITAEQPGKDIDLETIVNTLKMQAKSFSNQSIAVKSREVTAQVTSIDLEPLMPTVQGLFKNDPPEIKSKDKTWTIDYLTLASWIMVEKQDDQTKLLLNGFEITKWLDNTAKQISTNPQDAEFELAEDGKKVVKFALAKEGLALPRKENAEQIAKMILRGETPELILHRILPKILNTKEATTYGIKELIGQGHTNFSGSPSNRIKNIGRGADLLYGELIEAEEEFSLLGHLAPFTLENGYLAELVIKADEGRTIPEIGGGLCQIGTTMFRTVLNSGLPVTERRNHSYRVSYYEPPVGMDATIYSPSPDFKFINDTSNWLLLTAHIDGNDITFKLWGTKDGRKIEMTEPESFNFRKPPEKKVIETLDLPVGKIRCTERAHTGSDAKFTYTVTYPDGEVKEKEFFSRYRPWQEVCLIGVESLPEPEEEDVPVPTED